MPREHERHVIVLDEVSEMSAEEMAETWAWFEKALAEGRVTSTVVPATNLIGRSHALAEFLEQRRK